MTRVSLGIAYGNKREMKKQFHEFSYMPATLYLPATEKYGKHASDAILGYMVQVKREEQNQPKRFNLLGGES